MKVVKKKLSDLHTSPRNVRKHTEPQIKEYIRSVEMFGQIRPVVADSDGEILAGNGLFLAMQKMGWDKCDCYIMEDLTEKQKLKLMLVDNRIYELGLTDMSVFDEIVKELDGDTDLPGWDEDLLKVMNAAASEVDEMINSYGAFSPEDTGQILRNQERAEEKSRETEAEAGDNEGQDEDEQAADNERFVICPNCGARICL